MDLLLAKKRLSYRKIGKKIGCHYSYVSHVAGYLNMRKKIPIMDFRGLLGRSFK
jgi:hypothetical protein